MRTGYSLRLLALPRIKIHFPLLDQTFKFSSRTANLIMRKSVARKKNLLFEVTCSSLDQNSFFFARSNVQIQFRYGKSCYEKVGSSEEKSSVS